MPGAKRIELWMEFCYCAGRYNTTSFFYEKEASLLVEQQAHLLYCYLFFLLPYWDRFLIHKHSIRLSKKVACLIVPIQKRSPHFATISPEPLPVSRPIMNFMIFLFWKITTLLRKLMQDGFSLVHHNKPGHYHFNLSSIPCGISSPNCFIFAISARAFSFWLVSI